MRITLVDNLVMPDAGSLALLDTHPHLGLLSIAAVATSSGHAVSIYDPKREVQNGSIPYDENIYDHVAEQLLANLPDTVGFSTLGCSFIFVLNVAHRLKQAQPKLPILLGGPHATMLHRQIMEKFSQIDVIVRFEAEDTFPQVLERLDNLSFFGIPGITWREASRVWETPGKPQITDLDSLPLLQYDYYPIESLNLDLLRIEAGRGCPFACTFCSTAEFFQRSFRLKSAARLVSELDMLNARYGFTEFKLDHDLFTVNREKVQEFCVAVKNRNYQWRVSARVDCVNESLLEQMADSGCIGMYFGIETGSKRMQKITQKRLKLDLVKPTLDIAERLGIEATLSFITGYPQELQSDLDATLDLIGDSFRRRGVVAKPQLHILEPEPGTPLFTNYKSKMLYDGFTTKFNASLLGKYDQSIVLDNPTIFPNYFYYQTQIPRQHQTFSVDAMDLLRPLDSVVTEYLLRFFYGRLSQLVSEMREWADQTPTILNECSILDFILAKFDRSHHLYSLIKYNLAVQSLRNELLKCQLDATSSLDTRYEMGKNYRLIPNTLLLADIHDCGNLLTCIEAIPDGGVLTAKQTGGLCSMLVVLQNEKIRTIIVDSGFYCLLELFRNGLTATDLLSQLGMDSEQLRYKIMFQSILELGVLTTDSVRPIAPPLVANSESNAVIS